MPQHIQVDFESRALSSQEGQDKLKEMNDKIEAQRDEQLAKGTTLETLFQTQGSIVKLDMPGVNLGRNPFPAWLMAVLRETFPGIVFNDVEYAFKYPVTVMYSAEEAIIPCMDFMNKLATATAETKVYPEITDKLEQLHQVRLKLSEDEIPFE